MYSRKCFRKNPGKWLNPLYGKDLFRNVLLCLWPRLTGTVELHLPMAFRKETFEKAWQRDFDILDRTSRHHFRDDSDVNVWFIRMRHIMEGRFAVRKPVRNAVFAVEKNNAALLNTVTMRKKPMICLNDMGISEQEFEKVKTDLRKAFRTILPEKSEFEN